MNSRTPRAASLKHALGVAAIVVLSIPGVLTALSPLAIAWASGGGQSRAQQHPAAGVELAQGRRAA